MYLLEFVFSISFENVLLSLFLSFTFTESRLLERKGLEFNLDLNQKKKLNPETNSGQRIGIQFTHFFPMFPFYSPWKH